MLRTILFAIVCLIILSRCAQQVTPTGGKRDSIPPTLVESNPLNKTLNFKGNKIQLLFDEYVVVDNINQKLIITPEADNPLSYKLNGESITINFKKQFKDSTTYTLNFADAIKDYAEKNPAKNLKLVFSTGNKLDSGRVYGSLLDIQTNKPLFDALVGLYNVSDTLNVTKQKPYYFSRTDSSGHFSIENVQVKDYLLIAIDDKNRNMLFNAKDERIGFITNKINAGADSTNYSLKMALSDNTPLKVQRTVPKVNNYGIMFNKNVDSVKVAFAQNDTLPYMIENGNTIKFFNVQPHPDTTFIKLTAIDSLGYRETFDQKIAFQVPRGKDRSKEPFGMTTLPESGKALPNKFTYQLKFNKPIQTLLAEQIALVSDSITKKPLKDAKYTWNQTHTILSIEDLATSKDTIKWEIPKGAIISVENDTLPKTSLKHPLLNEENYGTLAGKLVNTESTTQYIIQLLDEQYKIIKEFIGTTYHFVQIPQGKYFLRAIVDLNKNSRWDAGDITSKKQPEPIIYMKDKLLIKANFEVNDVDILIPKQE